MHLVINKCITAVKVSNFSGHYLRKRSTLGIGVLGYIGIVQHKEHSPDVLSIPPGTPCILPLPELRILYRPSAILVIVPARTLRKIVINLRFSVKGEKNFMAAERLSASYGGFFSAM